MHDDLKRLSHGFNCSRAMKKMNLFTLASPRPNRLKLRRQLTLLLSVPDLAPRSFPMDMPVFCACTLDSAPLSPVHTGDYSRRFRRQFVAENGDCRQKRRAEFGDSRRFWPLDARAFTDFSKKNL